MIARLLLRIGALLAGLLPAGCTTAPAEPGTAERLYLFDVGECRTTDLSNWSPGVDVGKPWVFANHCYLIRHRRGLLLWDTGFDDAIAASPDGLVLAGGSIHVFAHRPLVEQLAGLGIAPADVTHLALSHFHLDHAGNANLFARSTLLVQEVEHRAAFGPSPERFGFQPTTYSRLRDSRTVLLHGDHDVFGDGSVVILATPGHTPGHQSLLVRLPHTGALLLSGDVAHFRSNWEHRRTPAGNFDRAASVRSLARIDALLAEYGATLVIQHDLEQSKVLPKAPAFLD